MLVRWTEKLASGPQTGTSDSPPPPLARVMGVGRQQQVIQAITPLEDKRIASVIKTPDSNWHGIKYGVIERILQAKLKSSKTFIYELLVTGNKILIEARHYVWWGSGMSFKMSTTTKPEYHPGQLWLDEILIKIRSDIQSENENELEISEVPATSAASQVGNHRSISYLY